VNHHALLCLSRASSDRFVFTLYLDKAKTAGSHGFRTLDGTKVGYVDIVVESSPEDRISCISSYLSSINM
jgi:hypothetical protein